jgi:hypothetical protein
MIESNMQASEVSLMAKGRELLESGDISSAVESYSKAYDPDSVDEREARGMLIEARSNLSRKRTFEALECFEEALLMGTEVQRRQALEGIVLVGNARTKSRTLHDELTSEFNRILGDRPLSDIGMAMLSSRENVVLLAVTQMEKLPVQLAKAARISKLPPHLADHELPIPTDRCIPFVDEEDVRYILEVATELERQSAAT